MALGGCGAAPHLRFCSAAGSVAAGRLVRRYTAVSDVSMAVPEISESPCAVWQSAARPRSQV